MRKIRDVLRLHAKGHSNRMIARSLSISRDSVTNYLTRAQAAGLSWPLPHGMDDYELEQRLFPSVTRKKRMKRPQPDWEMIYQEMKKKGATLQQLHLEYLAEHPDGLAYSSFCEGFRNFRKTMKKYMRQDYRAGEKVFVDYSGKTMPIHNPRTGEIKQAQIFVGVLGASNYTFAFASWTQNLEDWIEAHVRMFEFFGGVPECVV
ncbi:MAG: IS21 family transposase, partial [Gammaproteobacteria bacterium]